jgi:hypothetical protein
MDRGAVLLETATDDQGRYSLEGVPEGAFDLAASLEGTVAEPLRAIAVPANGDVLVDLSVRQGAEVEVTVRRDDGKPVEGAGVALAASGFLADEALPSGTTDTAGRLVLRGVPRASLWLLVRAPTGGLSQRERVEVRDASRLHKDITLASSTAVLKGVVHGGARPLSTEALVVKFRREDPTAWAETLADPDGRFMVQLARTTWRAAASQGDRKSPARAVDLGAGQDFLELELSDPPRRARVCVADGHERRLPGARVYYWAATARGMSTTEPDGCTGIGPFDEPEVMVAAELDARRGVGTLRGNQDLTISLQEGGRIAGRVHGLSEGASYAVEVPTDPQLRPSGVRRTFALPDFALDAPAGDWTLEVETDDGRQVSAPVHVRPGGLTPVDLPLGMAPR